jgi:hypothetical protein
MGGVPVQNLSIHACFTKLAIAEQIPEGEYADVGFLADLSEKRPNFGAALLCGKPINSAAVRPTKRQFTFCKTLLTAAGVETTYRRGPDQNNSLPSTPQRVDCFGKLANRQVTICPLHVSAPLVCNCHASFEQVTPQAAQDHDLETISLNYCIENLLIGLNALA